MKNKNKQILKVPPNAIMLSRAQASCRDGLTEKQVQQRIEAGLSNTATDQTFKTIPRIIRENVFTFFNFVFVILGLLLALVHSYKDMLFLLIILANTLIGIIQQIRSKKTLDKLTLISTPQVQTVRSGKIVSLSPEQLVRDDVVIFSSGCQICADATLLKGEVQADESLLSGESDPIVKKAGDILLSGSFLVSGSCYACLDNVGAQSYASQLTLEAKKQTTQHKSEMMASLDKLIRVIGFALIPIGIILLCKQYFILGLDMEQSVVSTVAALIGMIPEGLYLLTSVALAVSVINLARNKTLVHEMSCIETLARVDVLCVDKTGTITEPKMKVTNLISLNNAVFSDSFVHEMLSAFYMCSEISNPTARAMASYFCNTNEKWHAKKVVPFLSSTKWSAVTFQNKGTFVVGAAESILKENYHLVKQQAERHLAQGERVLLVCKLNGDVKENKLVGDITTIALVIISNPIRANASSTFEFFAHQGVNIKVISGDNPLTVSQIASRAKIQNADQYIDASTLKSDRQIFDAVKNYTVFGRVTPKQKRKFVQALQKQHHTVAMTGDGVNDVLALKDANVSVAMASGSDAACQAANLVLVESDFSAMTKIVMEGRRVINNIQRAASLFLVKNIFSFLLSFISVFVNIPYPVTPLQLSLISAFTIGIPAFLLAIEPNKSLVRGKFMKNVLIKAFPGGLTNLILILGVQICAFAFSLTVDELSTMTTVLLGLNGLLVLFQVCKPFDWIHTITWVLMTAGMVVSVAFFSGFYSLVLPSLQGTICLSALMLLNYPILRTVTWFFVKFSFLGHRLEWRIRYIKRKTAVYIRAMKKRK